MTVSQFVAIECQSLSIVNSTVYIFGESLNSYCLLWLLAKYSANMFSFT